MYSAIIKIWHGFLNSLAWIIATFLLVAIMATVLTTPVEIAKEMGYRWACKIIEYFEGE